MNNKNKKKYVSPSTRTRNNLRLLAFKAKTAAKGGRSPTRSTILNSAPDLKSMNDAPYDEDDIYFFSSGKLSGLGKIQNQA